MTVHSPLLNGSPRRRTTRQGAILVPNSRLARRVARRRGEKKASPPQWRKVPATKWRRRESFWKIHRNGVLCCCQIVACFVFYHSCTISLAPSDGEFTPTAGKVYNMGSEPSNGTGDQKSGARLVCVCWLANHVCPSLTQKSAAIAHAAAMCEHNYWWNCAFSWTVIFQVMNSRIIIIAQLVILQ